MSSNNGWMSALGQISNFLAVTPVAVAVATTFVAMATNVVPDVEALKKLFDWVHPDFAKAKFEPIDSCRDISTDTQELEFVYVHLDRDASDAEVLAEHERQGVRPATFPELLAHAAKHPDEQRKFPIVARGSVAVLDGGRCVAYLCSDARGRYLYLDWLDAGDWYRRSRFLAVRKLSLVA